MVEASVRAADNGRHARLDDVRKSCCVVAERFYRHAKTIFVRRSRDREGVPVPAVLRFDVDHRALSRPELDPPPQWRQRYLGQPRPDLVHGLDLVVVERAEEASEELPIDVEAETHCANGHVAPAKD